jgi:dienelactone hydrolase
MIVERTNYYAKPGRAADVLAIRRRACQVRAGLGLAAGTVHVKAGGGGPDVSWECFYATKAAHDADLAARAASPEFTAVRKAVSEAIDRFERHIESRDPEPLSNGMVDTDSLETQAVPREIEFQSGAHRLKGYLYLPPGGGPFPCLIRNHGSGIEQGTWDASRPATALTFMSWGIASFLPHRHGYGASPGPAWRSEVSAPFGTPAYDDQLARRLDRESDDVIAALAAIEHMPEIRADHVGVMGSSFGGTNTLLAASKSPRLRCAVEFAGAAMNWERTPALRALMTTAARKLTRPIFFISAANDYSVRPTIELAEAVAGTGQIVQSKVYPAFGANRDEGHRIEALGQALWAPDVRRFLERWL